MDLISVIIPVYNVEEYLRECVDSVLSQTYRNIEIILVDDGSTDSSGKICDEYAQTDKRIKVIHRENGGLSVARNTGLEGARGDYIYFLDSDDYILPDAFERVLQTAQKENAEIVFFDAQSFSDSDSFKVEQRYIRKCSYKTDRGFKIFEKLQNNNEFHSAVYLMFFTKQFLEKNNLLFVPGIYHEDMIFTYEALFCAERTAQCKESLYRRRYRSDSIMTSKKSIKHYTGCRDVYYTVRDFTVKIQRMNTDAAKKYIIRCAFNALNVYKKLDSTSQKAYNEDYRRLKKDILNNDAYGDTALRLRCHGKIFWFCYKIYEKTVGRLLGNE